MKFQKVLIIGLILVLSSVFLAEAAGIKTLIVTGQSGMYHDWEVSVPVLTKMLEETELFTVDVAVSPPERQDMSSYRPNFAAYDVVVIDYNGAGWPEQTKKDFVKYVKNGGGVVIFHAASNPFTDWKEYNEITGLGGWGGRNEKHGPKIRWRDGKVVRDTSPGPAGSHGPATPFQLVNRAKDHPVLKGLPEKWMHAKDELYSNLRGPAKNLTVLATAYADPANKGTGEHEPILFTVNYGKGRTFHTAIGHVKGKFVSSIECVGFITTFQRGAEWAATGKVTQKVPDDFPTATKVSKRSGYASISLKGLLKKVSSYKFGQSREPLTQIDDLVRPADKSPEKLRKIEKQLIEFLNSDATLDGKEFICRKLSIIGSKESVKILAKMLEDRNTSDMARYALERIDDIAVDDVLRSALSKTAGADKIGIINTLGRRRDKRSVSILAKLIDSSDAQQAAAAVAALGKIADSKAADVLAKAARNAKGNLRMLIYDAYLNCAEDLLRQHKKKKAFNIYDNVYDSSAPKVIRLAALRGKVYSANKEQGKIVLNALKEKDPQIQAVATMLVSEVKNEKEIITIAQQLPNLPPAGQVQLITALAERAHPAVREVVVAAAKSDNEQVSTAALKALGSLGDDSIVDFLVQTAVAGEGAECDAARQSLYALKGRKVDEAIIYGIPNADTKVKIELIRAVSQRNIPRVVGALLRTAQGPDKKVCVESHKALRAVATPDDMKNLVNLLIKAKDPELINQAQKTVAAVAKKNPVQDQRAKAVLAALRIVRAYQPRSSLIGVLGKIGDNSALDLLYQSLEHKNLDIRYTAVSALSEWPNPNPLEKLLKVVKTTNDEKHRIIALRGYIRLLGLENSRPPEQTVKMYAAGMNLAENVTEKKMLLSGLAKTGSSAAFNILVSYLDDDQLKQEAQVAVVTIAETSGESDPQAAKDALQKVIRISQNDSLKDRAKKVLEKLDGLSKMFPAVSLIGEDLSAWRPNTEWQIVGDALLDPKKQKYLAVKLGSGVIINGPKGKAADLFSKAQFGDVRAHIEFMVPKGSNSGVYFQERYEIQVFDSWGVKNPKYSDCGGIYQRWDEKRKPKGYQGKPPRVNSSLAPGKWQSFDIVFKAPRFDESGQKTANAVFEKVIHNGVVVHENEELTGPTRGGYAKEKPVASLRLQGDHGPVAYRNIYIEELN